MNMKIGFIGIGVMGSRMVKRLLDAKYEVTIYNRTEEKMMPLLEIGAKKAKSIATLAAEVDVLCTCLSMPSDVREVYLGDDGVLANLQEGSICVDFTTVDPNTSQLIEENGTNRNVFYLDAPVSGGPEGAEQGSLTIMVGGNEDAFHKVKQILFTLGEKIEYLGKSGSGSIAKLINQYLVAVHSVAASEAMVTGAAYGLNSEQLYEILKVSYGHSRMLTRHMENFVFERNFQPGGAVKYVHKDVHLANELLDKLGIERYLGQLAEESFLTAMNDGFADEDMSAIIKPLEKIANVEVGKKMNDNK